MNTALQKADQSGVLVSLSQNAMDIAEMNRQSDLINELFRKKFVEANKKNNYQGHYGVVPGTKTKSLLKPGAEMIAKMFRLGAQYEHKIEELPNGHINVIVTACLIHYPTQTVIGYGVGSCATMESKHRYRTGPVEFTGKPVPKEFWILRESDEIAARKLLGGPGFVAKKNPDTGKYEIAEQGEKVENLDPADVWNTALKVAKKRAYVDAIQTATAAGDIFMLNAEKSVEDDKEPVSNGNAQTQNSQVPMQQQTTQQPPSQKQSDPPAMVEVDHRFSLQYKFDQNGNPLCPKCNGPMWDNRKGERHAASGPDFACKDKSCKFQMTKAGNWVENRFPTCIFRIEYTGANEDEHIREPGEDDDPPIDDGLPY